MKYSVQKFMLPALLTLFFFAAHAQAGKKPLPRKDCFFGVHFDFHANAADTSIGKTVTAGMIDAFLEKIRPDFVQVDTKGHPGIASFPTRVGTPAGGFVKDALQIWRQQTSRHGVGLYAHYSGLIDKAAVQQHPEWAVMDKDKKSSDEVISIFSPYADMLMVPQVKELITRYKIDGIWIDGETWATRPDYSTQALAQFKRQTGIGTVPYSQSDAGYKSFLRFQRDAFMEYVKKYVNQLHRFSPQTEVGTNWLYSSFAPLPITANVDFLSGDMPSSQGDFYKTAFSARVFSSQALTYHKAWDLMSWGFDDNGIRSAGVLQQEAAQVISMGGAWQVYFPQNHDASIQDNYLSTLAEVAQFVRERQSNCQYARPVKQVAILYSGTNQLNRSTGLFDNTHNMAVSNALYALLDNQLPVEVLMEHQWDAQAAGFPLVVVPELGVAKAYEARLLQYAANGGTLLLLGSDNAAQFAKQAGIAPDEQRRGTAAAFIVKIKDREFVFPSQPFVLQPGTAAINNIFTEKHASVGALPVASVKKYGKGRIATLLIDRRTVNSQTYDVYKEVLGAVVTQLHPPIATVEGSEEVHLAINHLKGKTVLNLINAKRAAKGIIPPTEPVTVQLHTAKKLQITLQPGNITLDYHFANDTYTIQVPSFAIHQLIVAE